MRRDLLIRIVLAATSVLAVCRGSSWCLTDEEVFRDLRFNFLNPGARALGMGGAFVAAADDATAAQANPAALHYLRAPELFAEFLATSRNARIVTSRHGSLDPVSPVLPYLELTSASNSESATNLSYLSFSWPMEVGASRRRLVLAFSRQLQLGEDLDLPSDGDRTEARLAVPDFPLWINPDTGEVEQYSVYEQVAGRAAMEIVSWNAGASMEIHGGLSLGATLSYAALDVEMDTLATLVDPRGALVPPSPLPDVDPVDPDIFRSSIHETDSDLTYTVGIHWHPESVRSGGPSPWQLGAVFRKGARFLVSESTELNGAPDRRFDNVIRVPDRYAVGLSFKRYRRPYWTFGLDYERIEYGDLLDGFRAGVNPLTNGALYTRTAAPPDPSRSLDFAVEDAHILHAGVEYLLPAGQTVLGFLLGYFNEPDRRIRMWQFNSTNADMNQVFETAFGAGRDEHHLTGGISLKRGASILQLAGDFSAGGHRVLAAYLLRVDRYRTGRSPTVWR